MRAVRRECRDLLAEADAHATRQLIALYDDPDPRVRVVAIQAGKERLFGRAGETGVFNEEASGDLDISHLSQAEQQEAWAHIMALKRLTGGGDNE